jgi:glutathione synthase
MDLLFVADPLSAFNLKKDSTYAMMREAAARGHTLWACEPRHLQWRSGARVTALVQAARLTGAKPVWVDPGEPERRALAAFDAVIMRKDPPFDAEYIYATHLLEQAEREGARVFNRPAALRDHPEKLAVMEFADHAAPTLVTRRIEDVREFHAEHGDIILKPLDGMGGMGIFRVKADGLNLGAIVESLNHHGATTVMVQRFLPEIEQGDKRVLVIGGEPVPFVLARIPQGGEVRGNLAAGGKGVAQPLNDADRRLCEALGPTLAARGLLLVGLDVIGDRLTEVNVTSPTCFQEIRDQTGFDVAGMFVDALERALAAPRA